MNFFTRSIPILLGLLLASGCNSDGLNTEQQAHLNSALNAYRSNQTSTALEQCNVLLGSNPSSTRRGFLKARYLRALVNIRQNNPAAARSDINMVIVGLNNPFMVRLPNQVDDLEVKSRDTLGELDFREGNLAAAKTQFAFVLKAIAPESQPADHAAFRMGCIAQRLGEWSQGDTYFQQLNYFKANSPMAVEAKTRSFARAWSVQVGLYAEYSHATGHAARLTQAGWKARCVLLTKNNKRRYALRVGQWTTHDEAKRQLLRLRTLQSDAFIIPSR